MARPAPTAQGPPPPRPACLGERSPPRADFRVAPATEAGSKLAAQEMRAARGQTRLDGRAVKAAAGMRMGMDADGWGWMDGEPQRRPETG